ncbi:hypothetical protein AgCh_019162 [Apium graveolens]
MITSPFLNRMLVDFLIVVLVFKVVLHIHNPGLRGVFSSDSRFCLCCYRFSEFQPAQLQEPDTRVRHGKLGCCTPQIVNCYLRIKPSGGLNKLRSKEPNHSYTSTAAKGPGRRRRSSPATRSYHLALEGGALHPWVSVPLDSPSSTNSSKSPFIQTCKNSSNQPFP